MQPTGTADKAEYSILASRPDYGWLFCFGYSTMANSPKQQRNIEQNLFPYSTVPSPKMQRRWDERRLIMGDGPEVRELEYSEWMNEGQELENLKRNYEQRLADEIWNKNGFQQEINMARKIYMKNSRLRRLKQDPDCLWRLNDQLRDKYHLNDGWISWVAHCIMTAENDPQRIFLYDIRGKSPKEKHISLEVYFPLPEPVYKEAISYLRWEEREKYGDFYSQEQRGGAPKGIRGDTAKRYEHIANWYYRACRYKKLSQREFCKDANINLSELQRALKYVAKKGRKTD
jgi:hypothetical protein